MGLTLYYVSTHSSVCNFFKTDWERIKADLKVKFDLEIVEFNFLSWKRIRAVRHPLFDKYTKWVPNFVLMDNDNPEKVTVFNGIIEKGELSKTIPGQPDYHPRTLEELSKWIESWPFRSVSKRKRMSV